jgi:hypothetical protein
MFQQKKNGAVFEVAEVIPVMTNNYEDSIMKGYTVDQFVMVFSNLNSNARKLSGHEYVLGVSILQLSTISLFDFGTVSTE